MTTKNNQKVTLENFIKYLRPMFRVDYLGRGKFLIPGDPNVIVFANSNKNIKWYTTKENIYAGGRIKQGSYPIYHPKETLVKFLLTNRSRKVISE